MYLVAYWPGNMPMRIGQAFQLKGQNDLVPKGADILCSGGSILPLIRANWHLSKAKILPHHEV